MRRNTSGTHREDQGSSSARLSGVRPLRPTDLIFQKTQRKKKLHGNLITATLQIGILLPNWLCSDF